MHLRSYGPIPECVALRVFFHRAWTRGYTALSICRIIINWYFKRNIVQTVRQITCQVFLRKQPFSKHFPRMVFGIFWPDGDGLKRQHRQSYYSRSWGECVCQMSRRSPPITVALEEAKVIRADPLGTTNVSTDFHIKIKQASTCLRPDPSGAPADRAVAAWSPALAWLKRLQLLWERSPDTIW